MLLVRGVADTAREAGGETARAVRPAYRVLADVQRTRPDVVAAVIGHPAVGAWALNALVSSETGAGREANPESLGGVAAAAAVRAGHPATLEVPIIAETATLPSLGQASLPGQSGRALVRSAPGRAEVIGPRSRVVIPAHPELEGPGWLGLRRLTANHDGLEIDLLIDDLDPHRFPVKPGRRLTRAQAEHWQSVFRAAWDILVEHHWTTAAEVQSAIRVLTPLAMNGSHQHSATSTAVFGCTAMSPPRDGRTLALTLAHEIQHTKLSGLLEFVTLTLPDDGRRFYAPWRDDPRPAAGLLQGAYAHLGVSGFWRRQRHVETGRRAIFAHAEFVRWTAATRAVARLLQGSGCLTATGHLFVEGMLGTLDRWSAEPVPSAARMIAEKEARRHHEHWLSRNRPLGQCLGEVERAFDDEDDR
ncbi:HEXXH motif domain-containing protein [Actinoallomurus rhizosphaericola]|uniref:HEXXH motif domain-containing protein n=1 Tax=Actinoallomurus rhizosphaericola TaxID=2952536 RepID=UPI00209315DD|nr:HEXXH motif domain-containing protein [Actinoallomurus rhizosphaericola]MCO5996680.1 HEXXH motif domain-containing protein [Actinoallomurus rhizosphaericola]